MKKIILSVAFILAITSGMNASSQEDSDCAMLAWEYGTKMAEKYWDGHYYAEYYYTNQFYEDYCL